MHSNKPTSRNGYTLIELLLVIAIICVLSSIAIAIYRRHQINQRIEKAALEMQNFLAASLDYNANNYQWPAAHGELGTCASTAPPVSDFIQNYVPNQSATTSYGGYYCWGTINNSNHLFWLAIKIPANNNATALRLAALLPNGVVTTDPNQPTATDCRQDADCYVRAEISNTSANPRSGSDTQLAGVGNCSPLDNGGNRVIGTTTDGSSKGMSCKYTNNDRSAMKESYMISFTCPQGSEGGVVASPNIFNVGNANGDIPYALYDMRVSSAQKCPRNNKTHKVECTIQITARRGEKSHYTIASAGGYAGATYTAYCKHDPTPSIQTAHYKY